RRRPWIPRDRRRRSARTRARQSARATCESVWRSRADGHRGLASRHERHAVASHRRKPMSESGRAPSALIADDEPRLAAYLREKLVAAWPELEIVGVAGDGPEALRLIEEHEPDILFLDIRMPGLTGLEVASRAAKGAHVVFVTAHDQYAVTAFEQE